MMQVGTLMYTKVGSQVARTFLPIFPFLYDDLNNGSCFSEAELYIPTPPSRPIPTPIM